MKDYFGGGTIGDAKGSFRFASNDALGNDPFASLYQFLELERGGLGADFFKLFYYEII